MASRVQAWCETGQRCPYEAPLLSPTFASMSQVPEGDIQKLVLARSVSGISWSTWQGRESSLLNRYPRPDCAGAHWDHWCSGIAQSTWKELANTQYSVNAPGLRPVWPICRSVKADNPRAHKPPSYPTVEGWARKISRTFCALGRLSGSRRSQS